MRRVGAASLLALPIALLSGCVSFGFACPAIGYGSTAHIVLQDPRPGLRLELCDGEGCTPGTVMEPTEIGATAEPVDTGIHLLEGDSASGWSAGMFAGQPVLGYRVTDSAGALVAEGQIAVEWVRIDGDDRCGGNRAAEVVLPA